MLIEGETGTGKDLVARTVHALSKRTAKPFVIVDCGAVVVTAGAVVVPAGGGRTMPGSGKGWRPSSSGDAVNSGSGGAPANADFM